MATIYKSGVATLKLTAEEKARAKKTEGMKAGAVQTLKKVASKKKGKK